MLINKITSSQLSQAGDSHKKSPCEIKYIYVNIKFLMLIGCLAHEYAGQNQIPHADWLFGS